MTTIDVDALAQEIRRVDGENSLGAGALAEALMPFLAALPAVSISDDDRVTDQRLRWHASQHDSFDGTKMAKELIAARRRAEAAEAQLAKMREALKPFADAITRYDAEWDEKTGEQAREPDDEKVTYLGWLGDYFDMVTLGDFRRARAAIRSKGE